jgi:outer membrane protein, multidrug efflux system
MKSTPPVRRPISPPFRRPAAACAVALAAAALLLAGCTLGPDYQRPEVTLPTAWRAEAPNAADVTNTEWWRALGDAELDRLIDNALVNNKDLVLASLRVEALEARLQVSRAAAYPKFGYGLSGERLRRSEERPNGLGPGEGPVYNNFVANANVAWEIDLWGRVKRASEAARAELLSSEEARRAMMLAVVSSAATGYIELLALDQQLSYSQGALKNRQDAYQLAEQKFRGGSGTRLAAEQARAVAEEAAADIPPVERNIRRVENALSALVGGHPGPVARRQIDGLALLQLPSGVPADVLARRPDVLEAEQLLVAANARIGVAKTAYFPVISLTAVLGVAADDLRWLWAETARDGSFGGALSGPLFSGGRIEANIREAEALQKQAALRFQKAVQTALVEVEDALYGRSKAAEREAVLARQVVILRDVAALTKARYEGGESTLIDVLDAEQRVIQAQGKQLLGRQDSLLAMISVYKAMGGGWMVERQLRDAPAKPPDADLQARAAIDNEVGK